MQDPTTHAMTELSLALSMAFFSLLILSLISIDNVSDVTPTPVIGLAKSVVSSQQIIETNKPAAAKATQSNKAKMLIYFKQYFLDLNLKRVEENYCDGENNTILAVQKTISIAVILRIKDEINCPDLSITILSQKWLTRLEQL